MSVLPWGLAESSSFERDRPLRVPSPVPMSLGLGQVYSRVRSCRRDRQDTHRFSGSRQSIRLVVCCEEIRLSWRSAFLTMFRHQAIWLIFAIARSQAQELHLEKDGVGPLLMNARIATRGDKLVLTASARNDSAFQITRAEFCVRGSSQASPNCLFNLWTTHAWKRGEVIQWTIAGPRQSDIKSLSITVDTLRWVIRELGAVSKIYVDKFEGNTGIASSERIIAYLATSPRFQVVEDQRDADATIRGRADSQEVAQTETTAEQAKTQDSKSRIAAGIRYPIALAAAGEKDRMQSSKETSHTTQAVLSETLIIRLVTKAGRVAWGWDDSKHCAKTKPSCAVEDLIEAAGPSGSPERP
jgi:hypothetical protein